MPTSQRRVLENAQFSHHQCGILWYFAHIKPQFTATFMSNLCHVIFYFRRRRKMRADRLLLYVLAIIGCWIERAAAQSTYFCSRTSWWCHFVEWLPCQRPLWNFHLHRNPYFLHDDHHTHFHLLRHSNFYTHPVETLALIFCK